MSRRLQAAAAEKQDRGPTLPQPMRYIFEKKNVFAFNHKNSNSEPRLRANSIYLSRIVLDESVIPQKYARVLVRALYVDSIDFDLVDDKSLEIGDR